MAFFRYVKLNGEVLKVSIDGELPDITAKTIENTGSFILPGYSLQFWVFQDTDIEICSSTL